MRNRNKLGGDESHVVDLLEGYLTYCRENGFTDFGVWCQDNTVNEHQAQIVCEIKDDVNAMMDVLCFTKKKKDTSKNPRWVTFILNGKEIAAFTVMGMAYDEIKETVKLLAYEKGVDPDEIYIGTR